VSIDGSSSAVIENNFVGSDPAIGCTTPGAGLSVAAGSTATVQADYNSLHATSPVTEYFWAGTGYATAAAFGAATGQGAHDQDASQRPTRNVPPAGSPLIDSADCAASGELTTDMYGHPRVEDPLATHAGTGSCYADRGAAELQDPLAVTFTGFANAPAPLAVTVQITSSGTSPWSEPVSYSVNFGDGSAPVPVAAVGSVSHVYSDPGIYEASVTGTDTGGSSVSQGRQVLVGTVSAPTAGFTATQDVFTAPGYTGISAGLADYKVTPGPDAWEIAGFSIAFGDGTSESFGKTLTSWNHLYSHPGTYAAALTVTDSFGRQTTSTATITVGNEFTPIGPYPDGDFAVPAHGTLRLSMSRLSAAASFVSAAQLVVSVTKPTAAGSLKIYPDASSRPTQASLDFRRGRASSNEVLAAAGATGKVDIYNSSRKTIDVALETIGVESADDATGGADGDTFAPVGPVRVLDTRRPVHGERHSLRAGQARTFSVAGAGVPPSADQVVLDVTATGTKAAGSALLYSKRRALNGLGAPHPYWETGQTVTSLVTVPVNGSQVTLRNASKANADFMIDVVGYYPHYGTEAVFLPARVSLTGARSQTARAGHTLQLPVSGCLGAPISGVTAVMVNLAASGSTASGYLSVRGSGSSAGTRSLSFGAHEAVASSAIIRVGSGGAIELHNGGLRSVDVAVDLTGCYYHYPPVP
jgi:PKD repeat protein